MSKEAMKLALEALDNLMYWDNGKSDYDEARKAIKALEEALAKQEQGEPVAADDFFQMIADRNPSPFSTQQRKPLTDEQANRILLDMADHVEKFCKEDSTENQMSGECIRYILKRVAAHGIKE